MTGDHWPFSAESTERPRDTGGAICTVNPDECSVGPHRRINAYCQQSMARVLSRPISLMSAVDRVWPADTT